MIGRTTCFVSLCGCRLHYQFTKQQLTSWTRDRHWSCFAEKAHSAVEKMQGDCALIKPSTCDSVWSKPGICNSLDEGCESVSANLAFGIKKHFHLILKHFTNSACFQLWFHTIPFHALSSWQSEKNSNPPVITIVPIKYSELQAKLQTQGAARHCNCLH